MVVVVAASGCSSGSCIYMKWKPLFYFAYQMSSFDYHLPVVFCLKFGPMPYPGTCKLFHCILPMHLGAFLQAVLAPKVSSSLVRS